MEVFCLKKVLNKEENILIKSLYLLNWIAKIYISPFFLERMYISKLFKKETGETSQTSKSKQTKTSSVGKFK